MLLLYPPHEDMKSDHRPFSRFDSVFISDESFKSQNVARRTMLVLPAATNPTSRDSRPRTFLLIGLLVLQSIGVIGFFTSIVISLNYYISSSYDAEYQDMIGYLIIFIIATVFEVYIAIDSVLNQNTPQLLALCLFESSMCGFGALLPHQINQAISDKVPQDRVRFMMWRLYLVPAIMGLTALIMLWLTWFFARDFGWQTYKKLGANRELRIARRIKSIFFMLQKFNFFFLIGFCVLIVQARKENQGSLNALDIILPSLALAIPFLVQLSASLAVELELPFFLFLYGIFWLVAMLFMGYEIVKLRLLSKVTNSRHSLILFSTLTVLLLFSTGVMSIFCYRNFHKGLKESDSSSILRFWKKAAHDQSGSAERAGGRGQQSTELRVVLD